MSIGLFLVAYVLLAFFWPDEGFSGVRLWSATPLRELPSYVVGFPILFAGVAAYRVSRTPKARGEVRVKPSRLSPEKVLRIGTLATVVGLLTTFAAQYGLLGDNWLRVTEALTGHGNGNERGAIAFYSALVTRFSDGTLSGAAEVFRNVGRVSGLIYAMCWVAITGTLQGSDDERRGITTLAVFSGVFALFCGYLEIYAPLLALLVLVLVITLRAVRNSRLALLAPLLALGAAAFHLAALLWVPMAFVPLLARRITPTRSRILAATAAAAVLGIGFALFLSRGHSLFLRLTPTDARPYSLLSLSHLFDYANAQWLGSAPGVVLGGAGLVALWRRREEDEDLVSTEGWVTLWAWILPAIGLFVFNPVLGAADWDILSLSAPFGLAFALAVRGSRGRASHLGLRASRALPFAAAVAVLVAPAWFLLLNTHKSVEWTARLVEHDRADYYQTHPPALHLAFLYQANGLTEEATRELERGRSAHPNDPRFPLGLARSAAAAGRWDEAEALAMESYGIVRGYLPALDVLYDVYRETGRAEDQIGVGTVLLQSADADPDGVSTHLSAERLETIRTELRRLGRSD
ncbi:MAG: tetratricopeptide repeat protein [Candidatus Eisenbacteria bacterium]